MAIVNCPSCDQRISSRATQCPHCKVDFADEESYEQQEREYSNARFKSSQRLQNYSFIAVFLFATGALFMYLGMDNPEGEFALSGRVMLGLGFVGYIAARVMLVLHKRN